MLLATVDRNCAGRIQERHQRAEIPQLGVRQEIDGPAVTLGNQEPAVHEGIRMVAGENDGARLRHILESGHFNVTKEGVRDQAKERDEQSL